MTIPVQEHRRIDVEIPGTIEDKDIDSLMNTFREVDAVIEFRVSGHSIHIEYLFPAISYSEIWSSLLESLDKSLFSYFQILLNSFRAYLEENEQAHLTRQYGLEKYIRNVYISYNNQSPLETAGRRPGYTSATTSNQQERERS